MLSTSFGREVLFLDNYRSPLPFFKGEGLGVRVFCNMSKYLSQPLPLRCHPLIRPSGTFSPKGEKEWIFFG